MFIKGTPLPNPLNTIKCSNYSNIRIFELILNLAHKLFYEHSVCAYCLEFAQIWGQMWTAAHWLLAPGSPRTGPSIVVVQETRDCSFLYQTIILFN